MATFAITRIAGSSGAAGSDLTYQNLTANSSDNTTVTPAVVMTTTGLAAGTWKYSYYVNAQSAGTGVGISFKVNFTGTVTAGEYKVRREYLGTGGNATTGVMDGIAASLTGQMLEGFAHNVNNTDLGPNTGCDVANTSSLNLVEGFAVTTTSGNIELSIRSETAGTAVRITGGSNLVLEKIA